jgi:hypothetical protein
LRLILTRTFFLGAASGVISSVGFEFIGMSLSGLSLFFAGTPRSQA